MNNKEFWELLDRLTAEHEIVIDRPRNTWHPTRKDFFYELDYGYLKGTSSPDGEEIDVWIGNAVRTGVVGVICTVDMGKRDAEMKILLDCSDEDLDTIYHFYNDREYLKAVILRREDK